LTSLSRNLKLAVIVSLSALGLNIAGTVAGALAMDWLKQGKNRHDFQKALELALQRLEESGFALTGPGAIDSSFLTNKTVQQELWAKLLDPANTEDVDIETLFAALTQIWQGQAGFTEEVRSKQHQGVEFLVDSLYDILWQFPDFHPHLQARVTRRLDDFIPPAKRRFVIRSYLNRESKLIKDRQKELMGGADYVEPIIQKARSKPAEPPTRAGREKESWEEVDIAEYLLAGPDLKMAVVSDSGYGKTTLLQELFLRACSSWLDDRPIPFLFLPDQASGCTEEALWQKVAERLATANPGVRRNQLETLAWKLKNHQGKLLLLFDALDQVSDPAPLCGCLERLSLTNNRVIVTTRPGTWEAQRHNLRGYVHLRLIEFDRTRIQKYFGTLLNRPELTGFRDDFLGVPILAFLLRRLLEKRPEAAKGIVNRSGLYEEFFKDLAARPQDLQILGKRRPEDAIDDLRRLSFEALKRNHLGQVPRETAKEILSEPNLNDLERLQFLLTYIETGDNLVFRHRSFQEFLAAKSLKQQLAQNGIACIKKFLFHPNWKEPVRFLAGMLETTELEQLLNAIRNHEGRPLLLRDYGHLRLAASCLHEARTEAPRAEEWLREEIESLFPRDPGVAIRLLSLWASGWAEECLILLLINKNWYVRSAAASALGEIRSEKAVEPLIQRLEDENEHEEVRWTAVIALGAIGSDKAVEPLIQKLEDNDKDKIVRWAAAEALGRIKSDKAVEPLIQRLEDKDKIVRWAAAEALGRIKSDKAVEPLIQKLRDEKGYVRSAAAKALGRIKSDKAVEPLIQRLKDRDEFVRRAAARALGEIRCEKAVEPLIQRLRDPSKYVRLAAAYALGEIRSDKAVEPLIQRLKDEDEDVRSAAAEALGKIRSEKAVEPLIQRLEDENKYVRSAAADALCEIRSEKAVEPLLQKLRDENWHVRLHAAGALGGIKSDRAVEPLIQRLEDEDVLVRRAAAEALGKIRSEKAVEPLIQRLKDEDEDVRWAAAYALGEIRSDKAVEPLIQRLKDEDEDVRSAAADALESIVTNCPE